MKSFPTKDPDSNLRYYFDWSPWLVVEDGGTIVSYEVVVDEGDSALLIGDTAISGGVVMAWISQGTADVTYVVRCRVTLTDGSVEDASRELSIAAH